MAMKILSEEEYEAIYKEYNSLAQDINRDERLSKFILFFNQNNETFYLFIKLLF